MKDIEKSLMDGSPVYCAACPHLIHKGDLYVMRGEYMYCDEECAEEGDLLNKDLIKPDADKNHIKFNDVNWDEVTKKVYKEASKALQEKSILGKLYSKG